jgi:hypothetical protein
VSTLLTITISDIIYRPTFYLKTRRFGVWILSPSSGRTYSDEVTRFSIGIKFKIVIVILIHYRHKPMYRVYTCLWRQVISFLAILRQVNCVSPCSILVLVLKWFIAVAER